ncbi:MAG TPA: di-heme-cytochrome C peroxidase [Nitrospirales bacterium]|nr:hypothetical protein [Nitrospiraceae bacterium]HNP31234.1 di-heme-cytochrome C peroxidase [Nitrospirales bacterium]
MKTRLFALFFIGTLQGCGTLYVPDAKCWNDFSPWSATSDGGMNLAQCWDSDEQTRFYNTSQGSQIAPYDIATNIEWADKTEPFLSTDTINYFGYLVNKETAPWPLGWVKDSVNSGEFKGEWIGLTCAACHTAEIHYAGKRMRIDGAPTMADFTGFINALDQALEETYLDMKQEGGRSGAKFARLARRLGSPSEIELQERLEKAVMTRQAWHHRNDPPKEGQPGFAGYARLDAFGVIFNEVTNALLNKSEEYNIPENYRVPDAPVSYPFLWDTHFHDWVQWNGISPAIPMGRNVGQGIGVFGQVNMEKETTSIKLNNLRKLQGLVRKLRSPVWPETVFGVIDQDKAQKGEQLFTKHCKSCHITQKRNEHLNDIDITMSLLHPSRSSPAASIGTDPKMAENAARRVIVSRKNDEQVPGSKELGVVASTAIGTNLWEKILTVLDGIGAFFDHGTVTQPTPIAYKARPLDGIWATAPYLHNGSVPNLYETLLPEQERTKQFCVGVKDFDPQKVGFINTQQCPPGVIGTVLDTSLEGNLNTGHTDEVYGTEFTDEQRWQLVEYLKTL